MKLENDMIAMITTDSTELSTDMKQTVKKTVDMLDQEVLGSIAKSFRADRKALGELKKVFGKCRLARTRFFRKINQKKRAQRRNYAQLKLCRKWYDGESKRRQKYLACVRKKKAQTEEKVAECNEFAEVVGKAPTVVRNCVNHGSDYLTWITWNRDAWKNYKESYDKEQKECVDAKKAVIKTTHSCRNLRRLWRAKKRQCKYRQIRVELFSCKVLDLTINVNENYAACYDPALSAYQKEVVLLRKQEANRNQEWKALARVKCYLNVFSKSYSSKKDEMQKCRTTDFSTTAYNLNYWTAPRKFSRVSRRPYPCNPDYVAKYYTSTFDKFAPASKCQWCAAHTPTPPPTPEPTPFPTPFPTPPPTKPPTPPPTLAKGQGCKITIYSKKKFRGRRKSFKFPGKWFVGNWLNDKLQSWKATGSQCKFCFYKHARYKDWVGDRLAAKVRKLSTKSAKKGLPSEQEMMRQMSSVRILDMRYTTKCPKSG